MARSRFLNAWQRFRLYWPFTGSTAIVLLVFWGLHALLYRKAPAAQDWPDALQPFILLLAKLAFWFAAALVLLSVISAVGAWLYFLWRKRRTTLLQAVFVPAPNGRPVLRATLTGAVRPLLGFVAGRLLYGNGQSTTPFPLMGAQRSRGRWSRNALAGGAPLELPDVQEYRLDGAVVYFEDMLRLLSLPAWQPLSGHFHQPPVAGNAAEPAAEPRQTETLDVRINRMKRVEGDLLHYKDFEAGDDVRRIVWKVYARNRDLVVRVPERFEPFASHLYFYASFDVTLPAAFHPESAFLREALNHYKNSIWMVYQALAKSDAALRYVPDQRLQLPEALDAHERVRRTIGSSRWQSDHPLPEYFDARRGAVLMVSSLVSPEALREVLLRSDAQTVVYLGRLSQAFRHTAALHWLQRIFFRPSGDRLGRLRSRWPFSPLRAFLKKREAALEAVLQDSLVQQGVLERS